MIIISKYKLIFCEILEREIEYIIPQTKHTFELCNLEQKYHNTPLILQKALQDEIDATTGEYDAILLGYGLCSEAVVNLSSDKYKLVLPKAHDCISLFLGSKEKYKEYFDKLPGLYWYNGSWLTKGWMPTEENYKKLLIEYTEKYGEDNAEYLIEIEQDWITKYKNSAFVTWKEFDDSIFEEQSRKAADFFNWQFTTIEGNKTLLFDLLNGNWDNRFIIANPHQKIAPTYDDEIVKVEQA